MLLAAVLIHDNYTSIISKESILQIWEVIKAPYTIGNYFFSMWWNYESNYEKYCADKKKFALIKSQSGSSNKLGSTPDKLTHKFDSNVANYDLSTDKR